MKRGFFKSGLSKKDKGSHKFIVQSFLLVCATLILIFGKPAVAALQGTLSNNAQEQIADKFQIEYGNVNADHEHDWQSMGNRMHYCFCGGFEHCIDDDADERCDICMGSLHVHTWVYNGNFTEQTHTCLADNKVEYCLDGDADGYCDDCFEQIHEHDAVWVDLYSHTCSEPECHYSRPHVDNNVDLECDICHGNCHIHKWDYYDAGVHKCFGCNDSDFCVDTNHDFACDVCGNHMHKYNYLDNFQHKCVSCGHIEACLDQDQNEVCDICLNSMHIHIYSITDSRDATCTTDGYVDHECEICHSKVRESFTERYGHNYQELGRTPATCEEKGVVTYKCSRCGVEYQEEMNVLGHDYNKTVIEPTCTSAGYTLETCINCGKQKTSEPIPELGHDYRNGTVHVPTCLDQGYTETQCSRCGEYGPNVNIVHELGHDYVEEKIDATCTSLGYVKFTCANCGDTYEEDHYSVPHEYTIPNGRVDGDEPTHTCENCGGTAYCTFQSDDNLTHTCQSCGYKEDHVWGINNDSITAPLGVHICTANMCYYTDSEKPYLTVTHPVSGDPSKPDYVLDSNAGIVVLGGEPINYTVDGTADDSESGIAKVTVNGQNATINATDWLKTISLEPDELTTVNVIGYDRSGYTTEVIRYVWYDSGAPILGVYNPNGGDSPSSPAIVDTATIKVSGSASDPAGVKSVAVNGKETTIVSSGEMFRDYEATVTLPEGSVQTITVVATDNAGRTTTKNKYVWYDSANPTLTVTDPAGSSSSSPTYTTSSTYEVKGTTFDTSGIKSLTVNGSAVTVNADGSWTYTLTGLSANTSTTVTVVATDNVGKTTTITRYVCYDSAVPTLSVTSPTGSSASPTIVTSASFTAQGVATDACGIASVTVNGNAATVNSDGSWTYEMTLTADTKTTVKVVATDKAGRTKTVTKYVLYDSKAPTLSVTAPTGSSSSPTYTTSAAYTATGTVSDASGITSVTVNGNAATVNGDGTWSYALTLSADTKTTVKVIATDKAGRTKTVTKYVFYDSAAPTLTVTNPAGTSSSSPTTVTSGSYTASGTVSDASGIASVKVNGTSATISNGSWTCAMTLNAGTTTTVTVVATDNAGRTTTVTRYVKYIADSTGPTVNVTAPTGTSSGSPTYVQNDSTHSYAVTGTVSDASGIASVTVNGNTATVSGTSFSCTLSLATNTTHTITIVATDTVGNKTTVTRYVRVEAYYQQAARTAGATVQSSLANTLKNSSVCATIAGNSTAANIMKSKYSSTMTSYIDSNFSQGLNKLNYTVGLKTYLIKAGVPTDLMPASSWTYGYYYNHTIGGTGVSDVNSSDFDPAWIADHDADRLLTVDGGFVFTNGSGQRALYKSTAAINTARYAGGKVVITGSNTGSAAVVGFTNSSGRFYNTLSTVTYHSSVSYQGRTFQNSVPSWGSLAGNWSKRNESTRQAFARAQWCWNKGNTTYQSGYILQHSSKVLSGIWSFANSANFSSSSTISLTSSNTATAQYFQYDPSGDYKYPYVTNLYLTP